MEGSTGKIGVYLEIGKKRTFAGAIDWPGWCRSGRNQEAALQKLGEYGQRYADVLRFTQFEFQAPATISDFKVIERLGGDATTDFGAPGKSPSRDARPVGELEILRFQELLEVCWKAFDDAARAAKGKELRKGPRGGGRDLENIIQHVLDADKAYLGQIGWKMEKGTEDNLGEAQSRIRQSILEALASAARGELPKAGPRGGIRWTPRFFVRRAAWHVLDHAWEIEDRIQ